MNERAREQLPELYRQYKNVAVRHVEELLEATQSPIEETMLLALCVAAHDECENVRYKVGGQEFGELADNPELLIIQPQAELGKYRADFLLTYKSMVPDSKEKSGIKDVVTHLIVECDGHDFHDRTKAQASRDRKRDRDLKKLGFEVFRYTGADIWKGSAALAKEVMEHLREGARRS